jgi:thiazole synthase
VTTNRLPNPDTLSIAGVRLASRFFLGTAGYPSLQSFLQAAEAAGPGLITVSLRRELGQFHRQSKNGMASPASGDAPSSGEFWQAVRALKIPLLPNTAGCRSADEAITIAEMARELFATSWIKLEVIGCQQTLQPDPFELVKAAKELHQRGFEVFPYTTEDAIVAERLVAAGCKVLMPWGAPIGSGQGLLHKNALKLLRQRFPETTLVVDAGIGRPSHACEAMELGFDAVLVNTAVAQAGSPESMALAFAQAVSCGRTAFLSCPMNERQVSVPSTPVAGTPFWQEPSQDAAAEHLL